MVQIQHPIRALIHAAYMVLTSQHELLYLDHTDQDISALKDLHYDLLRNRSSVRGVRRLPFVFD